MDFYFELNKTAGEVKSESMGSFCYWAVRGIGYSILKIAGRLGISQPVVIYPAITRECISNERGIKVIK